MSYRGGYPGQPAYSPYAGAPQPAYAGAAAYQQPMYAVRAAAPQYAAAGAPAPPPAAAGPPPGVSPDAYSWFMAVDQDNSGLINAQELSRALQSGNNKNFSVQACTTMMGMFDQQKTGRINVQQFSQLFGFINQWTGAFKQADADNSGGISAAELAPVLQQQGYQLSPQTVQTMVAKFGTPGPAGPTLGLDGFILVNVQLQKLTGAFRAKDTAMQGKITIAYEEFVNMMMGALV